MDDAGILALYFARDERAVTETAGKYGGQCYAVSYQILRSHQDAEECVNDTYIRAWNAIPPARPTFLGAFILKITRNLSLSAYKAARAEKRGGGQTVESLTRELTDCVTGNPEAMLESAELSRALDRFLRTLSQKERCVFLRRYWYADSISEIAQQCRMAPGTVKSSLHRTRAKLKQFLQEEGIFV